MASLPPPIPVPAGPPPEPAGSEPAVEEPAGAAATDDEAVEQASQRSGLTSGWRLTLAGGWLAIMIALGLVANEAWLLGSPPFWLNTLILPYLLPLGTGIAALADWRHTLVLSWLAAVVLAFCGVADVVLGQPVVALFEGIMALTGLLLTTSVAMSRR
jgi:hypothetical protein